MTEGWTYRFFAALRMTEGALRMTEKALRMTEGALRMAERAFGLAKGTLRMTVLASLTVVALLGVSCAKMETPGDDGWNAIAGTERVSFSSSITAPATKESDSSIQHPATKGAFPSGSTFGVFAFYQPGTVGGAAGTWNNNRTPNFMFNQEVLFDGTDYSYSPLRYWPSNYENTLSFWAYSPYNASPGLLVRNTANNYTSSSKNIPDVRFTVTDGQTDFLYSNIVMNQTYASNSGVVPLEFSHALSLIDVRAEKVDEDGKYTVTLKSVSFKGLYMTAILKGSDWSWYNYSGSRQNLPVWEEDPSDPSDDMVLAHGSSVPVESVMPLPQDLDNDAARLHVEFSVSYLDDPLDPASVRSYSTSREVYLKDVFFYAGSEWTRNSHYVLTIKVHPDKPIQFTVSWSDWGSDYNYQLSS
ncbi:MAG: fimbrillin family protein [Bacteroidales bacterium]|nr:fimbrillin family protein [Bacteroidales bacterium]